MTLAPDLDNPKCSPTVLCRHSYVTESDDVAVDRESRDLQRIACLNSADIIVTHSPDSVRFMHRGGGWVEHDGESIAQVEVMLFRAYTAIETQIFAGDSGLLVGLDPLEQYTGYIPDGQDTEFYQSIVDDVRTRAMLRVDQLRKSVTRRHLSALAACVPVYAQDHRAYPPLTRLPAADFDQVKQWPVIALAAGGAIDLRPESTAHGKSGIRGASQARGRPGHGGGDASGLVARPDRGAPGERVYAPRVRCDRLGRARCTA